MKRALITGIVGQDGAYLAELLINKGYEVHGLYRRSSIARIDRLAHLYTQPQVLGGKLKLHYGDMTDASSILRILQQVQPDEVYNLAAQSHVRISFDTPEYTANADAVGTLRILEAIRILGLENKTRFYQASTSEMYGKVQEVPQRETTPFYPRSPYGVAKLYAHWITVNYREAYNIYACSGILFNHESPMRGENFVTRKITIAANNIAEKKQDTLYLGNLYAKRDWGYAKEYVEAMWLMLQQEKPQDYVIASGENHSVKEFTILAFKEVGIEIEWIGEGLDEKGMNKKTGDTIIAIDPYYYRPTEVDELLGDATKAKNIFGWQSKTSFAELVKLMVRAEKDNSR